MSAPPADRIVHDAQIGPDDTPHEAAAHVWAQVVAHHHVDPDDPLVRLGVLDRVVLVLHDVLGLSSSTVAEVLHTEEAAVVSAHATARARIGLPTTIDGACPAWQAARAARTPGDPGVLGDLVAHAAGCETCGSTPAGSHHARRGVAAGVGAAAIATPVWGGTLAAAAAIVTAGVAVGALVGPVPEPPLPEPVVVEEDPALPTDEEPPEGWPAGATAPGDGTADAADDETGDGGTADDAAQPEGRADGGDASTPLEDGADELGDALDDAVDDVTDTVQDTTDDVTDTVQDTADAVDDATGGATDDVTDSLDDTLDDAVDDAEDVVDDTSGVVDETADALP